MSKEIRIPTKKVQFSQKKIKMKTLEKAYLFFNSPDSFPNLDFNVIESFIKRNSGQYPIYLEIYQGINCINTITWFLYPNKISLDLYKDKEKIYSVEYNYPRGYNQVCLVDKYEKQSIVILNSILYSIQRYPKEWRL